MEETISERLFKKFCEACRIPCTKIPEKGGEGVQTPDFEIVLRGVDIFCEIKQIDLGPDDKKELREAEKKGAYARLLPNRLRAKLKKISPQLSEASDSGSPTIAVIYDNTLFKDYVRHADVLQAMFGDYTNVVTITEDPSQAPEVSDAFFGGHRRLTPSHNTSLSAIGILDGGLEGPQSLRLYHNPYAKVRLEPSLFDGLPVHQPVLPDSDEVSLQ